MNIDNINKYKKMVSDVLQCPVDEVDIYIWSYKDSTVEEKYSEYQENKEDQIKEYLRDSQDLRNLTFFEPFIYYFEESDEFIEVDHGLIDKYLSLYKLPNIIKFTGRYIDKDKFLDTP